MKIGEINPKDKRFWPDKPDEGFSPERNKAVIDRSISKYEAMRRLKRKEFNEQLRERTDAIASYLAGANGAQKSRSLEKYFGRRYLAHLRGESIIDDLRTRLGLTNETTLPTVVDSKGRLKGQSVQKKKAGKI